MKLNINFENLISNLEKHQKYIMMITVATITIAVVYIAFFEGRIKPSPSDNELSPLVRQIGPVDFSDIQKVVIQNKNIFQNNFTLDPNTPKILPTYEYSPKKLNEDEIKSITSNLNVNISRDQNLKIEGRTILANKETKNLAIYVDLGSFIYTDNAGFDNPQNIAKFKGDEDLGIYQQKAEEFLRLTGVDIGKYGYDSYSLRQASVHLEIVNNLDEANLIEFVYIAKQDNIPIVGFNKDIAPSNISIMIDKNQVIKKINAVLIGDIKTSQGTLDIKNEEELKAAISNGQAAMVDSDVFKEEILSNVTINKAMLAYYNKGSRLIPIFILDASIKTASGKDGIARFFVDGIKRTK